MQKCKLTTTTTTKIGVTPLDFSDIKHIKFEYNRMHQSDAGILLTF